MDESKFLEAEKLINKIHQLENCIENHKNNNKSCILINWTEYVQTINTWVNSSEYRPSTQGMEERYQKIPEEYEQDIIELLENKLNELRNKFKEL